MSHLANDNSHNQLVWRVCCFTLALLTLLLSVKYIHEENKRTKASLHALYIKSQLRKAKAEALCQQSNIFME